MIFQSKKTAADMSEEASSLKCNADADTGEAGEAPVPPDSDQAEDATQSSDSKKPASLSDEDKANVRRQALKTKLISASFGEIIAVLMRAPTYRHYSLSDMEWLVVPPMISGQFLLAEARSKEEGFSAPVGIALWARVSEEVDKKLSANLNQPIRLAPHEWTSGDIHWLIDVVGDKRVIQALINRLGQTVFKGTSVKVRGVDDEGNKAVRVIASIESEEQTGK